MGEYKYKKNNNGFTIIELVVVIVVIGILATIGMVSYKGLTKRAIDASVMSDIDHMDSLQTAYGLRNKVAGLAYYSGLNGASDDNLGFTPSEGNIIDVVISSTDYCIRGYNPKGTTVTIDDASEKGSSSNACDGLDVSVGARNDSDTANPGDNY